MTRGTTQLVGNEEETVIDTQRYCLRVNKKINTEEPSSHLVSVYFLKAESFIGIIIISNLIIIQSEHWTTKADISIWHTAETEIFLFDGEW